MRKVTIFAAILLAGCGGDEHKKSDLVPQDEINRRVATQLDPQVILFPDIEKNDLYGPNCAFAPEGHGIGAVAILRKEDGYMKLRDKLVRFAADSGSAELPMGARSRYTGMEHTFVLTPDKVIGAGGGKGRLVVTNLHEITVYDARGDIQCNA